MTIENLKEENKTLPSKVKDLEDKVAYIEKFLKIHDMDRRLIWIGWSDRHESRGFFFKAPRHFSLNQACKYAERELGRHCYSCEPVTY